MGRDHDVGDALTGSQGSRKGNVKATHLVTVALHNHFAQGSHSALALICEKVRKDNPDPPAQIIKEVNDIAAHAEMGTADEDRWAMHSASTSHCLITGAAAR